MFDSSRGLEQRHLRLAGEHAQRITRLIERMVIEYKEQHDQFHIAFSICLNDLLLEIYRLVYARPLDRVQPISRERINPKIEHIVRYLSQNYFQEIMLKDLADTFHVNPYYLCHLFKETTGTTITEFLLRTRIRKAKIYLRDTDLPVTEISNRTGFNTLVHFSQTFKKLEGVTARDYRKHSWSLPGHARKP